MTMPDMSTQEGADAVSAQAMQRYWADAAFHNRAKLVTSQMERCGLPDDLEQRLVLTGTAIMALHLDDLHAGRWKP